jgi:predicted DNA binding CopG/RHH family protein
MTTEAKKPLTTRGDSEIIGIRLTKETALAVKQEAARRGMKLNQLFQELWNNYNKNKRKS